MRHLLACIILLCCLEGFSQNYPQFFSLVEYAPKLAQQNGTNCYAYAAAYVNLTIQKSFKAQIKNPAAEETYSFGFVDGAIQDLQKQYGKKKFIQLVGDSLYEGSTAGINNLDYAFFVLHTYGTTTFSSFPYTDSREIKQHYNAALLNDTSLVKTGVPVELYNPDSTFTTQIVDNFKHYLTSGIPVIIAIDQPSADCEWENINDYFPDPKDEDGNHILNIVGYNNGDFILKNNYEPDCISSYSYENVFKILRWAYVIQ